MPNTPVWAISGHVDDVRATQKPTSGGSSETEKKLPMARPSGRSSTVDDTTVTPVGKWPSTWRYRDGSISMGASPDPVASVVSMVTSRNLPGGRDR